MSLLRSALALAWIFPAVAYTACPLLGPVFESPTSICDSTSFQSAAKNLTTTLDNASILGLTRYGSIPSNITSFSIGVFSATSPVDQPLFSYQHTAPSLQNGTEGTTEVTPDSIYRIGSLSKLITIYLFLIEAGPRWWNYPITEFVPQLEVAALACRAAENAVDCVDWDAVTLGALASHMAGLPRDYSTLADLSVAGLSVTQYGLPPLHTSDIPTCGTNYTNACDEEEYLRGYTAEHPIFAPFTSPVYSNGAFELLTFALENITGRSTQDMVQKDLFNRLGMTHSSYDVPANFSNAVLPGGSVASGFIAELGGETPVGGYYSSQNDLMRMGQSVLSASLLTPTVTRQWMKPVTYTSSLNAGVGMPWEIWRVEDLADHVVDLYTKSGDVFAYSSLLVLSPEYDIGFVVLAVGSSTTSTVEHLADTVVAAIIPALSSAAREQADMIYAGTYSGNSSLNSSMTLETRSGEPGLILTSWISNSTDLLATLTVLEDAPEGLDVRLYPAGLRQSTGNSTVRVGFRGVIERKDIGTNDGGVFSPDCSTWAMTAGTRYGNVGIDEFVFVVENGRAIAVEPRALRTNLDKV